MERRTSWAWTLTILVLSLCAKPQAFDLVRFHPNHHTYTSPAARPTHPFNLLVLLEPVEALTRTVRLLRDRIATISLEGVVTL